MFIPCDHCLRRHATHTSELNEKGETEHLQLCSDCYRKLRETLDLSQNQALNPPGAELASAAELQAKL